MLTKIKICGIKDQDTVQLCNRLGVDYLGFNLIKSSPRFVDGSALLELSEFCQNSKIVAVMLYEDLEANAQYLSAVDGLQIYQVPLQQLPNLKKFNKKIIYPVSIKDELPALEEIAAHVDYFIFDTFHGDKLGGTGECFDWNLLKNFSLKPFFVSGGLNADNIDQLFADLCPYAVDVASGVETEGQKDKNKITNFVQKIRSYEK